MTFPTRAGLAYSPEGVKPICGGSPLNYHHLLPVPLMSQRWSSRSILSVVLTKFKKQKQRTGLDLPDPEMSKLFDILVNKGYLNLKLFAFK